MRCSPKTIQERVHAERCLKAAIFARTPDEADLLHEIAANIFEQAFQLDQLKMRRQFDLDPPQDAARNVTNRGNLVTTWKNCPRGQRNGSDSRGFLQRGQPSIVEFGQVAAGALASSVGRVQIND